MNFSLKSLRSENLNARGHAYFIFPQKLVEKEFCKIIYLTSIKNEISPFKKTDCCLTFFPKATIKMMHKTRQSRFFLISLKNKRAEFADALFIIRE